MNTLTKSERVEGGPGNGAPATYAWSSSTRGPASEFSLSPNHTPILLIDFQQGILELSKTVEADWLRAAAVRLIKLARLFDIPESSAPRCLITQPV